MENLTLSKLEELTKQIEATETGLKTIENEVLELEKSRLDEVIKIAMKGLKFDKIYSNLREYSSNGFNRQDDDYEYFAEKGIRVATNRTYTNEQTYNSEYKERELFLLGDGSFKVYYKYSKVAHSQGSQSTYTREISKYQEIEQFEFDTIIMNIMKNLNKRLENLGERTKTQKERLTKIEALKVK